MRAGQMRELERLSTEARQARLARIYAELDKRRNPQHGPGPDEWPEDLWELREMREKLCV